jgi:hypothetical protein
MIAGCGALATAGTDNIKAAYGILVVAGLGIGGIVVPASISKFNVPRYLAHSPRI